MSIKTGNDVFSQITSHFKLGEETPPPSDDYYRAMAAEKAKKLCQQNTMISSLCMKLHSANLNIAQLTEQNVEDRVRLQMYSERAEMDIRKVEELGEEKGEHLDTINTFIATEQKQQNTIQLAEAQALAFIKKAKKCGRVGDAMLETLSIKYMGAIDSVEWETAFTSRFGRNSGWSRRCVCDLVAWQYQIQNLEWNPFKSLEVDGTAVIDEDDPRLKVLVELWGEHHYALVVTALKEMKTYNWSGRRPTPVLWDTVRKEPLELGDFIGKLNGNLDRALGIYTSSLYAAHDI